MPQASDLPLELQELRSFLPIVVRYIEKERGFPYASVLVTHRRGTDALHSGGTEKIQPVPAQSGICVRVFDGKAFNAFSTNRLERGYIMRRITDLCDQLTVHEDGYPIDPGEHIYAHFTREFDVEPLDVSAKDRIETVRSIVEQLKEYDSRIVNTTVRYRGVHDIRLFASRDRLLSQNNQIADVLVMATAREGKKQAENYDRVTGSGHEISDLDPDFIPEISDGAIRHLLAGKVEPGTYAVVLGPDMAGVLAHEAFGHGCELDTILRGASRAARYIGKRVGSDLVTIADYPGFPDKHGSFFFSDEGVLVGDEPTILVKNGILQPTLLTDLYSFTMLKDDMPGLRLSPNGRREDYGHFAYARMSTTYFVPLEEGTMSFEDMVAEIEDGLYIEKPSSGMEDPLGWGIQLQALRATRIKNGKLTDEVYNPIGMTGYVPEVLMSIDAVGSELVIEGDGHCGKGHKEVVRVADGGPYLRCKMDIG